MGDRRPPPIVTHAGMPSSFRNELSKLFRPRSDRAITSPARAFARRGRPRMYRDVRRLKLSRSTPPLAARATPSCHSFHGIVITRSTGGDHGFHAIVITERR
jgi:hypothetical protein